jgi:hypothetical protein
LLVVSEPRPVAVGGAGQATMRTTPSTVGCTGPTATHRTCRHRLASPCWDKSTRANHKHTPHDNERQRAYEALHNWIGLACDVARALLTLARRRSPLVNVPGQAASRTRPPRVLACNKASLCGHKRAVDGPCHNCSIRSFFTRTHVFFFLGAPRYCAQRGGG